MKRFSREQVNQAERIAHKVIGMHVRYPAPDGHQGFRKLIERVKKLERFMKTGKH